MSKPIPNVDSLRSLLTYNPETGAFHWAVNRCNLRAGTKTGCRANTGYLLIRVNRSLYLAHRLAWMMSYGKDPGEYQVDHIDGLRDDNRIANLRLVTNAQNQQNRRKAQVTNQTGILGVGLTRNGAYRAHIKKDGNQFHLGQFSSAESARRAYIAAKKRMHECGTLEVSA